MVSEFYHINYSSILLNLRFAKNKRKKLANDSVSKQQINHLTHMQLICLLKI